jgi:4-amino-4-deoxy-L-arabinose transferase-like glycosyltransferase
MDTIFLYSDKICKYRKVKWLYWGAIVFGFGILSKYNIVFLALGFIPAILVTKQRKIFTNPHVYWSVLIALMIISPNLFWQYHNGFPVIHHMKELSETQLVNVNRLDFSNLNSFLYRSSFCNSFWFLCPFVLQAI